jgi:hypothetical protein
VIKGINGQTYVDLEQYIDMDRFMKLQPELYRGFAEAREFAKEGTWMKPGFEFKDMSYTVNWKPVHQAMEEFLALPDDDPIKINGMDLYRDFKDYKVRNKFTRYIKIAMGAYDPYIYYFLWEEGEWDDRPGERKLTEESKFFPNIVDWIKDMQGPIFESIGRVIVFFCEHDGIPFEHRDLGAHNGIWDKNRYEPHNNEFIHIRPNTYKPFYIWDPESRNKTYINSRAAWWNDQDWHGGDRVMEQSYGLRIDGKFSEEFRKKLGIDHLESY